MINFNLVSTSIGDTSMKTNSPNEGVDNSFKCLLNEDSLSDENLKSELTTKDLEFSKELKDFLFNLNPDIDLRDEEVIENIALGLFVYKIIENIPSVEISETIGLKEIEVNFEEIMDYFMNEKESVLDLKSSLSFDENISEYIDAIEKVFENIVESVLELENEKKNIIEGNSTLDILSSNKDKIDKHSFEIESIVKEFISTNKEIKNDIFDKFNSTKIKSSSMNDSEYSSLDYVLKELSKVKDIVSVVAKSAHDNPINMDKENYNNFLLNQRIGMVKETIEDNDLKSKIEKISNIGSNNEVTTGLSQHTYRTDAILNDKIKPTVTYSYIQKDVVVQEIPKVITNMNAEGLNEIVLRVKPKELGEISIHLTKNSDVANIVITVESDELFNVTKRGLLDISAQLKEIGMKVDNITIQMKENNQNANMDFMTNSESNEFKKHDGNSKNNSNKSKLEDSDDLDINSLNSQNNDEINILA